MKTITLKEIHSVLDEAFAKGTVKKPYSILFVCECGTGVKSTIEEWLDNRKEKVFRGVAGHYGEFQNGILVQTEDYGFDASIKGSEIVFQHYEVGCSNDKKWQRLEHEAYLNLIHKRGLVVDDELKLVITRVHTPLWANGSPMFSEDDYRLFNEVVFVEADVAILKEYFLKEMAERLAYYQKKEPEYVDRFKELVKIGTFVLDHPKFKFIPIETDGSSDSVTGKKYDHFTPLDFMLHFFRDDDEEKAPIDALLSNVTDDVHNLSAKARVMLLEILKDYR